MTDITKGNEEERKANSPWLPLLWLSPWVVILVFFSWHIMSRNIAHKKARNNWTQDRVQLLGAYMEVKTERDTGYSPSDFTLSEAQDVLGHLRDDVQDLAGAGDESIKKEFLDRASACIAQPPPGFVHKQPDSQSTISVVSPPTQTNELSPPAAPKAPDACATMIFNLNVP